MENTDEGQSVLEEYGIESLSQPSKAFFAGDKAAYEQAFSDYKTKRRYETLNEAYLCDLHSGDNHWFERNLERFDQLLNCLEAGNVVPFIGAGISVAGGFPTWKDHLRQQGKTAKLASDFIEQLLADGRYEAIIAEIESKRSRDVFTQEIRDVFDRTGSITDTVWRIAELFTDTAITTNYDRLIEQAYDTGKKDAVQVINGMTAMEKPDPARMTVIKLHGDIKNPAKCILSKNQYDQAYGLDGLSMEKPIPKLLAYYFKNSSLLFLGCSLNNDRTTQVFREIKQGLSDEEIIPQHFSIEQAPEDEAELADRNQFLLDLGVTAIWFEKDRFEYIDSMLSLAKDELRYRGMAIIRSQTPNPLVEPSPDKQDIDLSSFMRDFVDLMPLMHWLHRRVPQSETSKYLLAMQHVFHAYSFFTENTNAHLLSGLDHILRAISNNPHFDGYTHQNLSVAFWDFQVYFESIGQQHHLNEKFEWNCHELMTIPMIQFEDIVSASAIESKLDFHAARLVIALLKHGLKQERSPKKFCELAESVNAEFGDYLALTLSSKLGLSMPDRLEDMLANDISDLCQNAWNEFDRPFEIGFLNRVKMYLIGLKGSNS